MMKEKLAGKHLKKDVLKVHICATVLLDRFGVIHTCIHTCMLVYIYIHTHDIINY